MNATATRRDHSLLLAVDRELWQIGAPPGLPSRVDGAAEDQLDDADVHLSPGAFLRLALGLERVATIADYDADVEYRSPSAHEHLARAFPPDPSTSGPLDESDGRS